MIERHINSQESRLTGEDLARDLIGRHSDLFRDLDLVIGSGPDAARERLLEDQQLRVAIWNFSNDLREICSQNWEKLAKSELPCGFTLNSEFLSYVYDKFEPFIKQKRASGS